MLLASQTGNTTSSYTPASLNTYLKNNGGYSVCLAYPAIAAAMDGSGGVVYQTSTNSKSWTWLDGQLAQCRRVLLQVNGGSHWVLCLARTGPSGVGSSYKILDPGNLNYTAKTLSNFSNNWLQGRSFSGTWKSNMPAFAPQDGEVAQDEDGWTVYHTHTEGVVCEGEDYITRIVPGTDGWLESTPCAAPLAQTTASLDVVPNPANTLVEAIVRVSPSGQYTIALMSAHGKTVASQSAWLTEGEHHVSFDTSKLPSGLYEVLVVGDNGVVLHSPLMIQH